MAKIFERTTDPLDLLASLRALTARTQEGHILHDFTETAEKYLSVLRSKPVKESVAKGVREMMLYSSTDIRDGDMLKLKKADGSHILRMVFDVEAAGKKGKFTVCAVDAMPAAGIGHNASLK